MRTLILASSSKPRQELLSRLRIPFEVAIPNVDETPLPNEKPAELVMRLAEAKAKKVAEQFPNAIIIGADQVGILENEILCKPLTLEKAEEQLTKMSGKCVMFYIGICLFDSCNQTAEIVLETFSVTFRVLTPTMISNYLSKEQVLQCAGSFKAEGLGIALVNDFHDKDYTALIGLPLIRLTNMLEKMSMGPLS